MTAVDGHGLRCIVFLQGCSKRCVFCCNPDTWSPTGGSKLVSVSEVLKTLRRNLRYYRESGGGLTLSGGECLLQPEFCRALCRAARSLGLTAAVDTAAEGTRDQWDELLPHVDLALVCVKSANPEKHRRITRSHDERPHRVMLAFLDACERHGVRTWLRFVLMSDQSRDDDTNPNQFSSATKEERAEASRPEASRPEASRRASSSPPDTSPSPSPSPSPSSSAPRRFASFATDGEEDIRGVASLAKRHANVAGVELLPYHRFGVFKWTAMGVPYPLRGMRAPTAETTRRVKARFEALGVRVIV